MTTRRDGAGPLVSAADLANRLGEHGLVVCDVRYYLDDHDRGRREYADGHVPGAVFVDLPVDLAGGPGGGRHPLPTTAAFGATLGRLGITPESSVVVYDDRTGGTASRLWWMLRSIGHTDVALLDGGFQAWVSGGHPLGADPTAPATASPYPVPAEWSGIVDADQVVAEIERGTVVLDAREPVRYRGESEPIDSRAGHIPGARNLFHRDTLGDDGLHLPAPELTRLFGDVGPSPIVYCGSGISACHNLLAMSLAGIDDARLYPGSWSEWSSDPERPVATAS